MSKTDWHAIVKEEIFKKTGSSLSGLSSKTAKKRLAKYGPNKLKEEKPPSDLRIFLRQFKSAFVAILTIAFFITIFLREYSDALVIFIAVILNTIVGFIQEDRANRALLALKKMIDLKARVIRGGQETIMSADELAPGDIIILKAGSKIPADARLLEIYDFETNEAALTGESTPVAKILETLSPGTILAERKNMVFMGTTAVRGRAKAIVVETGMRTAIGDIAKLVLETREEPTPLEQQIKKLAVLLSIIIVIANVVLFLIGFLTGKSVYEMFLTAVAVAVATVPEGLLVSMTVALAIGMQKLIRDKAIVRTLLAAETLGSVSVICVDKTGTLTEGEMKLAGVWTNEGLIEKGDLSREFKNSNSSLAKALEAAVLSSEAVVENPEDPWNKWRVSADPTQKALVLAGAEQGVNFLQLKAGREKFDEIPFDSIRKYTATAYHLDFKQDALYLLGAPERIIERSDFIEAKNKTRKMSFAEKKKIIAEVERFAGQGFRVVAVGYKKISCDHQILNQEERALKGFVFLALFFLRDPLRPETKEMMTQVAKAGIKTVMITGDHRKTAETIGRELGIKEDGRTILTGEELEAMSDDDFEKIAPQIRIYARVSPSHKSRIVDALQKRGEVVAMTGDGVNDAPALKSADIGIAVGGGTDVAKETADVVLLDNNFKTIVKAVEGGRVIFDNIRKVVVYLLSDNFHEFTVIALSLVAGLPLPILPAQILWIKLAEDALPSMALAFEKGEKDTLKYPPRPKESPILENPHKFLVFIVGLTTSTIFFSLFVLLWHFTKDLSYTRTIIFTGLTSSTLLYIYSCRSLHQSIFKSNPFTNRYLIFSTVFGVLLLMAAIYVPFLQKLLRTVPLSVNDWMLLLGALFINIFLIELLKMIFRRLMRRRSQ